LAGVNTALLLKLAEHVLDALAIGGGRQHRLEAGPPPEDANQQLTFYRSIAAAENNDTVHVSI
jgi:hypothetical protein